MKKSIKYCFECGSQIERYYSVESAAKLVDCSEQFFRNLIRDKNIRYVKFGRLVRIPASEIVKLRIEVPSIEDMYV
ncbi:MAG: excisionase family DNA-binding protein [Candidatus Marinimicrobia bacterium]|nr:excisionase family DNA-binding protein [Candidatus Neomarinimicrobiota bacterium]MBL7047274.1 excisionase family DNA-binding protein [Candidatus Neomarinimicrobiota bacterium]